MAVGDLNADNRDDIVVAAGIGGGPRIAMFDGLDVASGRIQTLSPDFFAFEPKLRNGAFLDLGDVNGDSHDDLISEADHGCACSTGSISLRGGRSCWTISSLAIQPLATAFM